MLNKLRNILDPRPDAISLLKDDHRQVEGLFETYKSAKDKRTRAATVRKICVALQAHTKIEEKVFYPEVKKHKALVGEVNEALVEHAGAKKLIAELKKGDLSDELFDARVTVLEEYIKHHVKEEETEMFPHVQSTELDLVEIGAKLEAAKQRALKAAR